MSARSRKGSFLAEKGALRDESKFRELIEAIELSTFKHAQAILQNALSQYGLMHFAYGAINLPTKRRERPLVMTTYSTEWQSHYIKNEYINIDPAVRTGIQSLLPIDWAEVNRDDQTIKKFFGEAHEFNVGRNGLSIPIRGRHGEFGLFTTTTPLRKTEWEKVKRTLSIDLFTLAYYFHDWALKVEGIDNNDYVNCLTTRERDCLRWKALGKSDWDISKLLSISERTVQFHLDNARYKLGAMNTTHAVTKALSYGLIATL